MTQNSRNPQNFNKYSYCINNPLKLVDPTWLYWEWSDEWYMDVWYDDNYVPPAALTLEEMRAVQERGMACVPQQIDMPLAYTPMDNPIADVVNFVVNLFNSVLDKYEVQAEKNREQIASLPGGQTVLNFVDTTSAFLDQPGVQLAVGLAMPNPENIVSSSQRGIIKGFTSHGIDQAIARDGVGVNERAMLSAVKNPLAVISQADERLKYVGQNAVVILNNAGKVVTTWARNKLGWRIR